MNNSCHLIINRPKRVYVSFFVGKPTVLSRLNSFYSLLVVDEWYYPKVIVCTGIDNACYVLSTLKGHRGKGPGPTSACDPVVPAVGPTKIWIATDSSKGAAAELEMNNSTGDGLSERSKHFLNILMQNESTQKNVHYLMLVMTKYMEIVQKQIADLTVNVSNLFPDLANEEVKNLDSK
ncbi:dynamin-2 [Trichonephila clavipes]|nr:dynamin-2 [Trichonephila clavipes]